MYVTSHAGAITVAYLPLQAPPNFQVTPTSRLVSSSKEGLYQEGLLGMLNTYMFMDLLLKGFFFETVNVSE